MKDARRTRAGTWWPLVLSLLWSSQAVAQFPDDDNSVEGEDPLAPAAEPDADAAPEPEAPDANDAEEPGGDASADAAAAPAEDEAAAEPPEEPDAAGDADETEVIVVTGSRIKRSVFAASAPVEVISRKELEYSGASNLIDVIQHLTLAPSGGFQGGSAVSSVNLRGLGAGATLVLLNGRRMGPTGGGIGTHFADIATVPLAAVERIEILKGGASAIYGSDAVAGVINIITRSDWDGTRMEGEIKTTDDLDWEETNLSAAFGASSDRGRVVGSMAYLRATALDNAEREEITRRGDHVSTTGFPGAHYPASETGGFLGFPVADPGCGDPINPLSAPSEDGSLCTFDFNSFQNLARDIERVTAFTNAEYDLTDHTQVFGEFLFSRTRTYGINSPSLPFPPPFPVIPADHIDNSSGMAQGYIGRPVGALGGPVTNSTDDDAFRAVFGFKGDFGGALGNTMLEDWTWEALATFGVSRYLQVVHDTIRPEFQRALESCSDPLDLDGCFNPYFTSVTGEGTPNTQGVIDSFSGTMTNMTDHGLRTYNLGLAGDLFELPGGDLGFAVGGEIRREFRATDLNHDSNTESLSFLVGNTDAKAARNVYGGYLELLWPILNGVEIQTAGRVERYDDTDILAASPTVGLTLTPQQMAGGNVPAIIEKLQLRGHVARAFRAPTIYNTFPGFSVVPGLFTFPDAPAGVFLPVQAHGNPDLEPEKATAISGGFQWSPVDWLALTFDYWQYDYTDRIAQENPNQILRDQLASATGAADVTDERLVIQEGCTGTLSQCVERIRTRGQNSDDVFTNGLDFAAFIKLDGATFGGDEEDFGELSFGATGTYVLAFEIDQDQIAPVLDGEGNTLRLGADGAITSMGEDDDALLVPDNCDGETCDVSGQLNSTNFASASPKLRMNIPVTWSIGGHGISVILHYLSALDNDGIAGARGNFTEIGAFTTLDLQYGYTLHDWIGEATTLRVGAYNILEAIPPAVPDAQAGFTALHDPRGRVIYAKLIQEF